MKREKCVRNGGGEKVDSWREIEETFFYSLCSCEKKKEGRKKGERKGDGCERQREFSANQKRILITRAEECRFRSGRPPVPFELMA